MYENHYILTAVLLKFIAAWSYVLILCDDRNQYNQNSWLFDDFQWNCDVSTDKIHKKMISNTWWWCRKSFVFDSVGNSSVIIVRLVHQRLVKYRSVNTALILVSFVLTSFFPYKYILFFKNFEVFFRLSSRLYHLLQYTCRWFGWYLFTVYER